MTEYTVYLFLVGEASPRIHSIEATHQAYAKSSAAAMYPGRPVARMVARAAGDNRPVLMTLPKGVN